MEVVLCITRCLFSYLISSAALITNNNKPYETNKQANTAAQVSTHLSGHVCIHAYTNNTPMHSFNNLIF